MCSVAVTPLKTFYRSSKLFLLRGYSQYWHDVLLQPHRDRWSMETKQISEFWISLPVNESHTWHLNYVVSGWDSIVILSEMRVS